MTAQSTRTARTKTPAEIKSLRISAVFPNPDQPRKTFPEDHISELAASIKANGLLQPIRVTRRDGGYMIIAGECRFRAHVHLGMKTIRAEVVEATDSEVAISAIVENLQRRDVSPLEEARAFQRAMDAFGYTQEELAAKLGMRQSWRVTERTALLKLRPEYQDLLATGQITPSQGFELSRLSPAGQVKLFAMIRSGQCDSYNRLRACATGLLEGESQSEMFAALPKPTEADLAAVSAVERKISAVCQMLAKGFDEGEIVIVKKVDPNRAGQMADELRLIAKHVLDMEKALRVAAARGAAVASLAA